MKGLVLSGGKGTRLRPLTFTRAKQLIPIANKPILFYVIEDLVEAGATDIGVIISPETGDEIVSALGDGADLGAKLTFIPQAEPLGLAHAVKTAKKFLGDDDFVMYLGDNMLSGGITDLVETFSKGDTDCTVLLTEVDNPQQFGVAVLDDAGRIVSLVEKPANPTSNLALVGVYLFTPVIHDVIEMLTPSARGEYEITDAISGLVDRGLQVTAHKVAGWWKDTGQPKDLLEANELVLSQIKTRLDGEVADSTINGQVIIEPGARVVNSTVHGPAHIAAGAIIEDSTILPYTSIGPGAKILRSELGNSIVMADAEITDAPRRLDSCVLGQAATIRGHDGDDGKVQFVLGDSSQVRL